jgi:hypothetical protein
MFEGRPMRRGGVVERRGGNLDPMALVHIIEYCPCINMAPDVLLVIQYIALFCISRGPVVYRFIAFCISLAGVCICTSDVLLRRTVGCNPMKETLISNNMLA